MRGSNKRISDNKKNESLDWSPEENIPNTSKNTDKTKEIGHVTYAFVFVFLAFILYQVYFMFAESPDFINNSYNPRHELLNERVERGTILAKDGSVLAAGASEGYKVKDRYYPYGSLFSHAVGYAVNGRMGIESIADFSLLRSNMPIGDRLENDLKGKKNLGDTIVTTFDVKLQKAAYEAVGDNKGAVIAMNIKTGDVLALVSKPDFDPNEIEEEWEYLNGDTTNSPLLNRATSGLYPPGSTFKIITALEYMKENGDLNNYNYDCNGYYEKDGCRINCFHGSKHGNIDFETSFAKSCNSSFANITEGLNKRDFQKTCKDLLFNSELPIPVSYKESSVPINSESDMDELLQTGIGQGKVMVTPFHMCMITAAIANDGVLMRPRVISKIKTSDGDKVKEYKSKAYGRLMSSDNAYQLKSLMREVVERGTATKLKDTYGYEACGKTGSAEYNSNTSDSHAWFTGFAPVDDPQICVTVILEGAGSGGEKAVPVAKKVFDEYFD